MKIAAGYVRTSGNTNPESSIPNQINQITDYCKVNNIVLMTMLIDERKTGSKTEGRESYLQLKNLINTRAIDTVIVAYSDRLARDSFEFVLTLQEMNTKNIEFISISEHIKGSNLSPQEIVWMGVQNEMENKARSKRMKDARDIVIREGKCPFTRPPFGYRFDDNRRLVVEEKNKLVVKKIYDMFLNKITILDIVSYLNSSKIEKDSGKEWVYDNVLSILKRKTYTGYMYSKDNKNKLSPVRHEAIITEEVHNQVITMLKNRRKKVVTGFKFYLANQGILKCIKCNSDMKIDHFGYVCKVKCQKVKVCPENIEKLIFLYLQNYFESEVSVEKVSLDMKKNMLFEQKNRIEKRFAKATITNTVYEEKLEEVNQELNLLYKTLANNSSHFEMLKHLRNKNKSVIKEYLLTNNLHFVYSEKENIIKVI
jgi:site-specific DNA recombinase